MKNNWFKKYLLEFDSELFVSKSYGVISMELINGHQPKTYKKAAIETLKA